MRHSLLALLICLTAAGCTSHETGEPSKKPGVTAQVGGEGGVPTPVAVAGAVGIGVGVGVILLAGLSAIAAASLMSGGK